jgi:hypothetical protein
MKSTQINNDQYLIQRTHNPLVRSSTLRGGTIRSDGGCQTPHFVLGFTCAQSTLPHFFPTPDGLDAVVYATLS